MYSNKGHKVDFKAVYGVSIFRLLKSTICSHLGWQHWSQVNLLVVNYSVFEGQESFLHYWSRHHDLDLVPAVTLMWFYPGMTSNHHSWRQTRGVVRRRMFFSSWCKCTLRTPLLPRRSSVSHLSLQLCRDYEHVTVIMQCGTCTCQPSRLKILETQFFSEPWQVIAPNPNPLSQLGFCHMRAQLR